MPPTRAALVQRLQDLSEQFIGLGIESGLCRIRVEDEVLSGDLITVDDRKLLNFGTAAYLGLNTDPRLKRGAIEAIERFGPVFSSSPVYTSADLYGHLEERMERIFDAPVILPTTTTLGHMGALPVLVGPQDVVVIDAQAHASLHMATLLLQGEGIPVITVPHNDIDALEATVIAESRRAQRVWYLADGVYSMYGDALPSSDIETLLNRHEQLHVYVDDAHGFGWKGQHGRGHVLGTMTMHPRLVVIASLAKSFGSGGAAIAFHDEGLARRVLLRGSTFTFSGPIHPAELGAAVAAADIHLSEEHVARTAELHRQMRLMRDLLATHGLTVASNETSPIWFLPVGTQDKVVTLVTRMMASGFYVNPGAYPAVPLNAGGVRFAQTLYHSDDQLGALVAALAHNSADLIDHTSVVVDLTDEAAAAAERQAEQAVG